MHVDEVNDRISRLDANLPPRQQPVIQQQQVPIPPLMQVPPPLVGSQLALRIPNDFMNVASLKHALNRIQDQTESVPVTQATIDNIKPALNFGQRQILSRQLIYDHPITIALAPAACGKSRTAAYYLKLRTQKNPGELIIVAVEGNKPAQRLVLLTIKS